MTTSYCACSTCGATKDVALVHVVPLALGGATGLDNVAPRCPEHRPSLLPQE